MIDVVKFQCKNLQDHLQHIKRNFENFKSPYENTEKDLYKKELDNAIPRFFKYLSTFSSELQKSLEVQEMCRNVNYIQAELSMNMPSMTGKPSGKKRLNILA